MLRICPGMAMDKLAVKMHRHSGHNRLQIRNKFWKVENIAETSIIEVYRLQR
jgi:hypothetical protein